MDIITIKSAANKGDASAQLELAHAYRDGIEIRKNNAHYLSFLTKAAEQKNAEAIKELVTYHSIRRNKNADIEIARYWVSKGKTIGIVFSEDVLLKIGDADICTEKIAEYLFNGTVQFEKAKELILRGNISSETLFSWAEKYQEKHKTDKRRFGEITYLYLVSSKGDAEKINETALTLLDKSEKDNIKIAISLFKEGYRLGNHHAAASYMHCLLVGKGVRKNVKSAAKIYFEYKEKGIILSRAFSSPTRKGKVIKIPNSMEWKRMLTSRKIGKFTTSVSTFISDVLLAHFGSLFSFPNEYWDNKRMIAIQRENDAINEEIARGNYAAADGCRDEGCMEECLSFQRILFGCLGIVAVLLAIVLAIVTGHIPNWLVYTIAILFFYPSVFGIEGKVSYAMATIPPVLLLAYCGYYVYGWDWNHLLSNLSTMSIGDIVSLLLGCVIGVFVLIYLVYCWLLTNFLMGFWFHYLVAIEWKYGSVKAFLFAIISLGIILGGGYYLYCNGIIF